MRSTPKRSAGPPVADDPRSPPPSSASDVPESWLDRRLQGLHQSVIEETLPADFIGMLRAEAGVKIGAGWQLS
jgi:hypothetical protein